MDKPLMNFKWDQDETRHILYVPNPSDPDKAFDIAILEELVEDDYYYIVTGRLYNHSPSDDFDELGTFSSLEEAKKALEKEMTELFTEEFEYWKKIMGAPKDE